MPDDDPVKFFPGSKVPRNQRTARPTVAAAGEGWDANPRFLPYRGQTIAVFPIGAFAQALNRKVLTIRALERKGIIPRPALKEKRGENTWRVYTRDQIQDMIDLARDEDCLDPTTTRGYSKVFVKEAHRILRRKPTVYE